MNIQKISGLIAAPFTPMHPDGEINSGIIEKYHRLLVSNGVAGAFINGSSGEGVSTTNREKILVAEAWAKASSGSDLKVISHLGGTCYKDCIELARESKTMGLHAVALTSPSYFKPANVKMLTEFFCRVAERTWKSARLDGRDTWLRCAFSAIWASLTKKNVSLGVLKSLLAI